MANFYGKARSNYFQVKDPVAFLNWVAKLPNMGVWKASEENRGDELTDAEKQALQYTFGIFSTCPDSGCWPSCIFNEDGTMVDFDLVKELAPFLAEGQVAVLMEIGSEKLRYLAGTAIAVDHTGKIVQLNLEDIYQKAFDVFGINPTQASY